MGILKRFNLRRLKNDFSLVTYLETGGGEAENVSWSRQHGFAKAESCDSERFVQHALPQLPRAPSLLFLKPHIPNADPHAANAKPFPATLSALVALRADCRDVIILDKSRVYFPGEYQAGECPPLARAWDQQQAMREVLSRFDGTHRTTMCAADEGYVVLTPRAANDSAQADLDIGRYLNILPHDQPKSLSLHLDIPGATSISMQRRMFDSRFATRYLVGLGIDVGGGIDSLALYTELFPLIRNVVVYDEPNGDAQYLENVPDGVFDFAYSSHCLEHVRDPLIALQNWIRVVRRGGYLVVSAPDEDLYEQGIWPSTFNADHKTTFTIHKPKSWSQVSVNVLDLVRACSHLARPISIATIDHAYRFQLVRFDQTRTPLAECAIEFVLRKL